MEFDKDLLARQEARTLAKAAEAAQLRLRGFSQEKIDAIVEAVAKAFYDASVELAELAARETGFGNAEDKTTKNRFRNCAKQRNTVHLLKIRTLTVKYSFHKIYPLFVSIAHKYDHSNRKRKMYNLHKIEALTIVVTLKI